MTRFPIVNSCNEFRAGYDVGKGHGEAVEPSLPDREKHSRPSNRLNPEIGI